MLFRAAGVEGGQQMTALVTPTSTGVRAALRREEIEFSLPLFRGGGGSDEGLNLWTNYFVAQKLEDKVSPADTL